MQSLASLSSILVTRMMLNIRDHHDHVEALALHIPPSSRWTEELSEVHFRGRSAMEGLAPGNQNAVLPLWQT